MRFNHSKDGLLAADWTRFVVAIYTVRFRACGRQEQTGVGEIDTSEAGFDVRFRSKADVSAPHRIGPCAMCGRLRVGKGFLHVCSIGQCSHVFGLLARFA